MNINAKENVKLILISLAFFFTQVLICGAFYGEATDTFWIQNLLQQGISGYEVFYVGVSNVLVLLFHSFNAVPWNTILLYGMLLGAFFLAVTLLKNDRSVLLGAVVFLLLFSDALLLLDFTQVSLLTSSVTLLYLVEQKTMKWYTYLLCVVLLLLSFLLRTKSVLFAGMLLLPYFLFKFHGVAKSRFVLPFVLCFGVLLFLKFNPITQRYSHQNSIRAKLSDYQLKIDVSELNEQELFELKCASVGLPLENYSNKVSLFVGDLSLLKQINISKVKNEIRWLGSRLIGSYVLLVLVLFGLLWLNFKHVPVLLVVYVFSVLFLIACFLKLPDRLLQPSLVTLVLMLCLVNEGLSVGRFKSVVLPLIVVFCIVRLGVKSSALKEIQLKNEAVLCLGDVSGVIRSSNISNRVMYLNPFKIYSYCSISRTIPLTGWIGLLPQVNALNNEINTVQTDSDISLLERWLKRDLEVLDATKGLYKTKKGTSN